MAEAEIREMLQTLADSNAELKRELLEVRQREDQRDAAEAGLRREIEDMRNASTDVSRGDSTHVSGASPNVVRGDSINVGGGGAARHEKQDRVGFPPLCPAQGVQ